MVPYSLSAKSVRRIASHTAVCGGTLNRFAQHPIRAHVHVLGEAGATGAILPHPLPEGEQEIGAFLFLKIYWHFGENLHFDDKAY